MSEPPLTQSEIDLLIRGVRSGEIPTGRKSLAPLLGVTPVDLTSPSWDQDRLVRRKLGVLDLVFERLGPLVQITLTKNLRFPVRAEFERATIQKFADFREECRGNVSLFEMIRLDPLRGTSMIILEPMLIYALIDALMGGLGVGEVPSQRELSEIEILILGRVRDELLRDLENAWRPWFPTRIEHQRSERASHAMNTISDDEVCHISRIYVSGDVLPRSPIVFVHPYAMMEPLFEATSERSGADIDPIWRLNLEQNLREVCVEVSAMLGTADVPARQLLALQPGDLLELERASGADIDVEAEHQPIFKAQIGRNHLNYAIQITQVPQIERALVDRSAGHALVRRGLISREQLALARVDERVNRRSLVDAIVSRGWVDRKTIDKALAAEA